MKKSVHFFLLLLSYCFIGNSLFAQVAGDYQTQGNGPWNDVNTWQTYNGAAWVAAITPPDFTSGNIDILTGHVVNITANVQIDQTDINTGAQIIIDSGILLQIEDDGTAAADLIINTNGSLTVVGTIRKNQGAVIASTSTNMVVVSGGTYEHNNTTSVGNVPLANWMTGSNCNFIGYTSFGGSPGFANNFAQPFWNVTWNCPLQTGNINFAGNFTTVNGNFTIENTGTGQLRLCGATSPTLTIGQDWIINGGDFVLTNSTGLPVVNLSGAFIHNNGNLFSTGSGQATVNFVAPTNQLILINPIATQIGKIDFVVKNSGGMGPSVLEFADDITVLKNDSTSADFTLEPGAGIIIRHADGIALTGNSGCVQMGGLRTFAPDAHYTYASGNPQITGTGLPLSLFATLKIDNSTPLAIGGVTFSQATFMTGATSTLDLTMGKFITTNTNLLSVDFSCPIINASNSSYIDGPLRRLTNSLVEWFFPVGDMDLYKPAGIFPQSGAGDYTIEAIHQTPPNNTNVGSQSGDICSVSPVEYWSITGNSASQIKLYWHPYSNINETALQTCNTLAVAHYDAGTSQWVSKGNSMTDFLNDYLISGAFSNNYNTVFHTFGLGCSVDVVATSVTQPSCGNNNGIIDVTVTGGTLPYSYSWSDGALTDDRANLGGGSYELVVTDGGGCTDTLNVVLVSVGGVNATAALTQPSCGNNNGAIDITVTGGSGSFLYSWSSGQVTEDITNVGAGLYIFGITDIVSSCVDTLHITLFPSTGISLTGNITAPTCGFSDGGIGVNTIGGNPPLFYSWNTGDLTEDIINIGAGTYTLYASDASSCTDTISFLVSCNCGLTATPTINQNETCFGNDGSATVTAAGGSGTYSYSWSPGAFATATVSTLSAGNYIIYVTDVNAPSCITTANLTILGPSSTVIATDDTAAVCIGSTGTTIGVLANDTGGLDTSSLTIITVPPVGDGTVTVNANGEIDFVAGPLFALGTTFTYSITDTLGCSDIATVFIINANVAAPIITPSGPTTFCQGDSVILTSNAPFGNLWSNGDTTASTTILASGAYTVTVTAGGCSSTSLPTSITVNPIPATPTISGNGPYSICQGGSVILSSSASSGNIWNPTGQNTQSITVNTGGTYNVTTTVNGCSATSSDVVITVNPLPATPVISASGPVTFCTGDSVVLTSNTATGNVWQPGGSTAQSITIFNSGTYTVTVTDGNNCSATSLTTTVVVNPIPAAPVISAGGPTSFCQGGSVTLSSSIASGNLWSPGGQNTQSITVSAAGTYSVIATVGGCVSAPSAPITVSILPAPTPPVVSASGPTTFCQGGNVTLSSSYLTGNVWTPSSLTSQQITVTTSGAYTVTYTDTSGCTATSAPVLVTVNPLPISPIITANGPTTICQGTSTILTSNIASGNLWSTNETTQSITVDTSGTYSVTITDANGCSATSAPLTITVNPAPPTPVISSSGSATICQGQNLTLTSSEATGNTWSNGTTTNQISVSAGGSYTVTVTNGFGCSSTSAPFVVTVNALPPTPVISSNLVFPICANQSALLTSSGGVGSIWSTGDTSLSIIATTAGNYTTFYVDVNGCASPLANIIVTQLPAINATAFTVSDAACGTASGIASVTASGGSGAFVYTWNTTPPQQTQVASNLPAGNYTVTIFDATNTDCFVTASTSVGGGTVPNVAINPAGLIYFCEGGSTILTASGASSYIWLKNGNPFGTGNSLLVNTAGNYQVIGFSGMGASGCSDSSTVVNVYMESLPETNIFAAGATEICYEQSVDLWTDANATSFQWYLDGQMTNNFNDTLAATVTGYYTVTATNNCGSVSSNPIYVYVHTKPIADFVYSPMPAYAGSPIAFTDSSISGVSWLWDFGDNNGTSTLQNPSYTYLNSGEYPVTIMIQDNIGCADTSIQIVQVLSNNGSSENFIPNVFSPNGDQIHDVFGLTLQGIDLESFKIFDRWGHLVFETDNINDKWDGKGLNKQPCTEGAYYYILVGKDANQEKWVRKGYVTLIR